ncbi:MAG: peptide MFS transporter [bacterium]|nr:peptide MFS transporter [bacterium]
MLKGHPKGLIVLFFSNMGERFGYYTMMAIFTLFFEAKFGLKVQDVGFIWGAFLFSIYFLPLFGGILADKVGYGKVVAMGIVMMFIGYGMMAVPGQGKIFIFASLFVIAAGTGFFKGNLAVIVGNLYETKQYKKMTDAAFNIYYMGINIGAFFAPFAAAGIRDWLMAKDGLVYSAKLPGQVHLFLQDKLEDLTELNALAVEQLGDKFTNLTDFCNQYVASLSQGYNAGFAIAGVSIVMSLVIFLGFKKYYKHADYLQKDRIKTGDDAKELTPEQFRNRVFALLMVFAVVIFFWMAFHQNGYLLTLFAKNYTVDTVGPTTFVFFNLSSFLSLIAVIIGLVLIIGRKFQSRTKLIGAVLAVVGALILYWRYGTFTDSNPISPEIFQAFNPIFVVFLTPVVVAFFAWLNKRGKEPQTPKKIGIGMMMLGAGWILMVVVAILRGLQSPTELASVGGVSELLVSPYWLISIYFTMTVAELFISPMGLAYVAKVAPPSIRGTMQGGWLAATAIGNLLSGIMGMPYARLELWQAYGILVVSSVLAGGIMFLMLKKLEKFTSS